MSRRCEPSGDHSIKENQFFPPASPIFLALVPSMSATHISRSFSVVKANWEPSGETDHAMAPFRTIRIDPLRTDACQVLTGTPGPQATARNRVLSGSHVSTQ